METAQTLAELSRSGFSPNRLDSLGERLKWFRLFRWAAVFGHAAVFGLAYFLFMPHLSISVFAVVQLLLIFSNICLYHFDYAIRTVAILGWVIVFDVLLLTALLYFYGGHMNPFSMVYLVHVVLAALLVSQAWTWIIALISIICFALLFSAGTAGAYALSHLGHGAGGFDLHLQGMLAAFVLLAFLIAGFVSRMRLAIDLKERELLRQSTNQDRLAALTQLSAGAAHELGTPLATINVALNELMDQHGSLSSDEVMDDLICMKDQLQRCSDILRRMAPSSGELSGEMPREFYLSEVLTCVRRNIAEDKKMLLKSEGLTDLVKAMLPFNALVQTLTSLLNNAFDATPTPTAVDLLAMKQGSTLIFKIVDRGLGMDAQTIKKLGEPFFTTKPPGKGTGLGIFLSRLLVSRIGGTLTFDSICGKGTTVVMSVPSSFSWDKVG